MEKPEEGKICTANGVKFYFNDNDCISIVEPKTINRYHEIKKGDWLPANMFFAFSNEQFEEGLAAIEKKGYNKEKDGALHSFGAGIIATNNAVKEWNDYCKNKDALIAKECDMQEIYFYLYNDFECCIDYDGDERAYKLTKSIFGAEKVKTLVRFRAFCK